MNPPTWRYVKHGRDPVNSGAAWVFQSDDGLVIAVPWNWRGFRIVGEAEAFLNTYVRMLEDRPVKLHAAPERPQPTINWHPSSGGPVTCDDTEHKVWVL